ncbi:MAG: hypothetical protein OXE99_12285 [Cellvibrionales bacterium]|nr:hypothetical protein [Cellvibrionales bacterium]
MASGAVATVIIFFVKAGIEKQLAKKNQSNNTITKPQTPESTLPFIITDETNKNSEDDTSLTPKQKEKGQPSSIASKYPKPVKSSYLPETRDIPPTIPGKKVDFDLNNPSPSFVEEQRRRLEAFLGKKKTAPYTPPLTEKMRRDEAKLALMDKIEKQRNACSHLWNEDRKAQSCIIDALGAAGIPFQNLPKQAQAYFQSFEPKDWQKQTEVYDFIKAVAPQYFNQIFELNEPPIHFGQIQVILMGRFGVRIFGLGDAQAQDRLELEKFLNKRFPDTALALKNQNTSGHYATFVPNVGFASAGFDGMHRPESRNWQQQDINTLKQQGLTQQEIDTLMGQESYLVDDAVKSPQAYLEHFEPSMPNRHLGLQPNLILLDLNKLLGLK